MLVNSDFVIYIIFGVGIVMAFGIGANDFSNSMGPAVGGKVIGLVTAMVLAAIFEFIGAMFHSTSVTETIRNNIIDLDQLNDQSSIILYGMISALLAAGLWLLFASARGWPVSTTHSIIGAILGFGIVGIGFDAVHWNDVSIIASSWVISPLLGGAIAFLLMKGILILILESASPVKAAKRWGPMYVVLAGFTLSLALLFKGMTLFVDEAMDTYEIFIMVMLTGTVISVMGLFAFLNLDVDEVEHAFYPMILFTVCTMAFAHGANDVANAAAPISIALDILAGAGKKLNDQLALTQIYLICTAGIILGMVLFGSRVLRTVGTQITMLSPCRAFCASLATAGTVVAASTIGLPVSTTHILIGAVLGVGLAEAKHSVHWGIIRTIFLAWLVTIPVTGILAALLFSVITATSSTLL
ncbi:MAG: inorganic phosphate transporter [Candidatus Thiodiazotropha sp. (ex Lucinoma borealis)]|nr:inorganic phosphate transporter [Candidatus Thiodiazotropha sp. (ex Lucinoma borealis)]